MPTPPPQMTHAEKNARAAAKKSLILDFLAGGEVYTSPAMAAQVMACSRRSADSTLAALVREGCLKSEIHFIASRKCVLFGITPHGLAAVEKFENLYFELGRTNSAYVLHHLQTQQARLSAEAAGWKNWQPGKILYNTGLRKVPDAVATDPAGTIVAIEIERHVKTSKRYAEILAAHLISINKKRWREIHYLTPPGLSKRLEQAFLKVKKVKVESKIVQLTDAHYQRFKFFELNRWPEDCQ